MSTFGLSGVRGLVGWSATLPAGFLTFWYLPPGLAMGTLLAWAIAAVTIGRGRPQPLEETSAMQR
ncbi:hypothetical protein OHA72_06265 [Dactylosporangium sp. NBC_01737]|uniref:hypothetical protein n=1 Tax=Dactylosporangium sp. NBC_01737 TaxID=2975959 RepID=UPI002E0D7680|nr:hypothetical protein OHA72_06265 [Dactylosporangium sp. NBC_01737]